MVGPNGAGKTTTIECLEGLRKPDQGTIRVLGLDPQRDGQTLRIRTGMQLQQSNLPERMKVWEALDLYASFYPKAADWKELLDQLGLEEKRNAPFCQTFRRAEAAPVHRPGASAGPAAGLPGRTDHRAGPASAPRHLGPGARCPRQGQDHPADHPFHGRGRAPVRPGGHPRPRADRGPGHAGSPDPRPGGGRTCRLQRGRDSACRRSKRPFPAQPGSRSRESG